MKRATITPTALPFRASIAFVATLTTVLSAPTPAASRNAITTRIPDTGVTTYYDEDSRILAPKQGQAFFGQDAHYRVSEPSYADNGNGTITDQAVSANRVGARA